MKTILDVIIAVDEKFSSEDKWTKGGYAKNASGKKVIETSPEAVCWCLDGCILSLTAADQYPYSAIANNLGEQTLNYLNRKIAAKIKIMTFRHFWNDSPERTFQDIKNLLKECKKELSA